MTPAEFGLNSVGDTLDKELLQLELRVAKRADELTAGTKAGLERDREFWSRAEREILGEVGNVAREG